MVARAAGWSRLRLLSAFVLAALGLAATTAAPAHAVTAIALQQGGGVPADSTVRRLVAEIELNRRKEAALGQRYIITYDSAGRERTINIVGVDSGERRRMFVELSNASRTIFRNQARLMSLCDRARAPSGWLGLTFESQNQTMRSVNGQVTMRFESYPTIVDVAPGSPAERAGVRRGDSLVVLGTTDVTKEGVQFDVLLKPGRQLPVTVRRSGEARAMTLVVARRPGDDAEDACAGVDRSVWAAMQPVIVPFMREGLLADGRVRLLRPGAAPAAPSAPGVATVSVSPVPGTAPTAPTAPSSMVAAGPLSPVAPASSYSFVWTVPSGDYFVGAELRRLSQDLADLTGADDGVFVVSVSRGSPAEAAGLKGGDVIVRANETPVVRPDQLALAMRSSDDRVVRVVVVRRRAKQTLTIRAP